MGSAAPAVKAALYAGLTTLYAADAAVQVIYGPRGTVTRSDLISVGRIRTTAELATIGPNRARTEDHDVTVVFSTSRTGPQDQQQTVTERCYALVAVFDAWLIASPNETLAITGAQQTWARVTELDLTEPDSAEALAAGRQASITTTVRVRTRI